jgi:hypothetical protein
MISTSALVAQLQTSVSVIANTDDDKPDVPQHHPLPRLWFDDADLFPLPEPWLGNVSAHSYTQMIRESMLTDISIIPDLMYVCPARDGQDGVVARSRTNAYMSHLRLGFFMGHSDQRRMLDDVPPDGQTYYVLQSPIDDDDDDDDDEPPPLEDNSGDDVIEEDKQNDTFDADAINLVPRNDLLRVTAPANDAARRVIYVSGEYLFVGMRPRWNIPGVHIMEKEEVQLMWRCVLRDSADLNKRIIQRHGQLMQSNWCPARVALDPLSDPNITTLMSAGWSSVKCTMTEYFPFMPLSRSVFLRAYWYLKRDRPRMPDLLPLETDWKNTDSMVLHHLATYGGSQHQVLGLGRPTENYEEYVSVRRWKNNSWIPLDTPPDVHIRLLPVYWLWRTWHEASATAVAKMNTPTTERLVQFMCIITEWHVPTYGAYFPLTGRAAHTRCVSENGANDLSITRWWLERMHELWLRNVCHGENPYYLDLVLGETADLSDIDMFVANRLDIVTANVDVRETAYVSTEQSRGETLDVLLVDTAMIQSLISNTSSVDFPDKLLMLRRCGQHNNLGAAGLYSCSIGLAEETFLLLVVTPPTDNVALTVELHKIELQTYLWPHIKLRSTNAESSTVSYRLVPHSHPPFVRSSIQYWNGILKMAQMNTLVYAMTSMFINIRKRDSNQDYLVDTRSFNEVIYHEELRALFYDTNVASVNQ